MMYRDKSPMTYKMSVKNRLFTIVLFACSMLLWKPMYVRAAEQTVANLVLMVNFEEDDNAFARGYKSVEEMYTGETVGVHSYIHAISDGQVEVKSFFPQNDNGQFYAITLPGNATRYASAVDDSGFIEEVIAKAKEMLAADKLAEVNASDLDTWQNGGQVDDCIDNVTFLVQAPNSGIFYPHAAGYGGKITLYGKQVVQYNIVPYGNLYMTQYGAAAGYAVVSHEFLHSLGAPDLYRTGGVTEGQPVGIWDEMAEPLLYGASYPLAYTRKDLGWLDIDTITKSGDYTLQPARATTGNRAYILKTTRSDSEFFVVEYRPGSTNRYDYDSLYSNDGSFATGGLIVYRVNTSIENHTNVRGENYIYVYRPGTAQNCEDATEESKVNSGVNAVRDAALTPSGDRTSLGSADLKASCTEDTIFYTGGTNSGIVINNVRFNADGTATFHVELPALNEENYWQMQGAYVSGLTNASLDGTTDGAQLYLAGIKNENYNYRMHLYSYDNASDKWAEQVATNAWPGTTDVLCADGTVYVAYLLDTDHSKVCVASVQNGTLNSRYVSTGEANRAKLLYCDGSVWLFYYGGKDICLVDITTGKEYPALSVADRVTNPDAFYFQGKWYIVYSNYAKGYGNGKIACYENGHWKDIYEINSSEAINQIVSCVAGDKIYIAATDGEKRLIYLAGDGTNWTEQVVNDIRVTNGVQLVVKEQIPYIFWVEGSELRAKYLKNDVWTNLADIISSDTQDFDTFCGGNTLYAATSSSGGNVSVRKMKTMEGTPDPDPTPSDPKPEIGSGNVVLTLPADYDSNTRIYIDGVELTSTAWQNDESKRLIAIGSQSSLGTMAQTAVAYKYNASGIPTGMYVWKLTYNGNYYTATVMPEFENLFSYHGFSVRYTGNTGIRCTFGIDSGKKAQLISVSGLNGYRIVEIGTLIMRPDIREKNPMIYGSDKVSRGRTYWVENGKTYNKVIRKTNGRDQFANVLTNLPQNRYNTAYVFRPYAKMEMNGSQMVIYGPEMSRSMYTVCQQILSRGDFKQGTSGYTFLKNIVDSVEKQ